MEHTFRTMRITVTPMGVFMTASEANRQRVLALLLAENEQMCTSVWAEADGPVGGVSPVPTGWPAIRTFPGLRGVTVAVGTVIADRPPHRSVRARLRTRLL